MYFKEERTEAQKPFRRLCPSWMMGVQRPRVEAKADSSGTCWRALLEDLLESRVVGEAYRGPDDFPQLLKEKTLSLFSPLPFIFPILPDTLAVSLTRSNPQILLFAGAQARFSVSSRPAFCCCLGLGLGERGLGILRAGREREKGVLPHSLPSSWLIFWMLF